MKSIILIIASVAYASSSPVYVYNNGYVPLAKTTLTSSSQTVDHGSTHVLHPVQPALLAKTTSSHSSQLVDHGTTHVLHAPLVQTHELSHPVYTVQHAPVVLPSTLVSYKTPDSAITHHSSTTHETVPYVQSIPFYTYHH
ncbi:unnamed protein product [Leptidea sinapis]|uniref:Uncharacterized protein n=1 Tax=Leptidea sinapis TaxID=189913 RepID=A0A5E4PZ81_9NEOP|nr:unnamed protein product [Leptidea sinapis]